MKKIIIILLISIYVLGIGILIPVLKPNNFNQLGLDKQEFADYALFIADNEIFENPAEKLLILKLRVRQISKKDSENKCEVYGRDRQSFELNGKYSALVDAYTFFGINYGSAKIECSGKAVRGKF